MSKELLDYILKSRAKQLSMVGRVVNRLKRYFDAVDNDDVERYHDYQDLRKGKITVEAYNRKWGTQVKNGVHEKHV